MLEPDGEAVRDGGRRVGDLLPGGGEPAAHRGVQEKVPLHTQDTARSGMDGLQGLFVEMRIQATQQSSLIEKPLRKDENVQSYNPVETETTNSTWTCPATPSRPTS